MSESPASPATEGITPGPWTLWDEETAFWIGVYNEPGRRVIADVTIGFDEPFESQQFANARLIAAAPDLLSALKELGDWVAAGLKASDEAWPDERCIQYTQDLARRARAAVDKAEGRS